MSSKASKNVEEITKASQSVSPSLSATILQHRMASGTRHQGATRTLRLNVCRVDASGLVFCLRLKDIGLYFIFIELLLDINLGSQIC